MFKKITLENFQAHKKLEVDFDTINCIVGPSDKGKSAVIRALYWVCFNKPGGDSFINWNASRCKVTVLLANGSVIRRIKSKNENKYELNDQTYVSFGAKVPEQIQEALGVDLINFQQQHDTPFWFALSDGEVSRQLNEIVNLGVIDHSLGAINSNVRNTKKEIEFVTGRIEETIREKRRLKAVPGIVRLNKQADELSEDLQTLTTKHDRLSLLFPYAIKMGARAEKLRPITELPDLTGMIGKMKQRKSKEERINNLLQQVRCKAVKFNTDSTASADILYQQHTQTTARLNGIAALARDVKRNEEQECRILKVLKARRSELKELTKGRCLLCGNKTS